MRRGTTQVYTGDGKDRCTAAFGLAIGTAGHGPKVMVVMFFRDRGAVESQA